MSNPPRNEQDYQSLHPSSRLPPHQGHTRDPGRRPRISDPDRSERHRQPLDSSAARGVQDEGARPSLRTRHTAPAPLPALVNPPVSVEHARARAETLERTLSRSNSRGALPVSVREPRRTASRDLRAEMSAHQEPLPQTRRTAPAAIGRAPSTRSQDEHRQTRMLSVFNSPTATYMWPAFHPDSDTRHEPIIYVNYRGENRSADNSPTASLHEQEHEDVIQLNVPELSAASGRAPSPSDSVRVTSTSIPTHDVPQTSVSNILEPFQNVRISHAQAPVDPSTGIFAVPAQRTGAAPRQRTPSGSHAGPSSRRADQYEPEQSYNYTQTDETEVQRQSPSPSSASAVSDLPFWEDYATQEQVDGTIKWRCLWKEPGRDCHYVAAKQLVKRHIETTHLKFKPFKCTECGKSFPQKTSLDTHMHIHTGDTPHACPYHCGISFRDPARRHRHMVEVHGYQPRQLRRKYRSEQGLQDPTE